MIAYLDASVLLRIVLGRSGALKGWRGIQTGVSSRKMFLLTNGETTMQRSLLRVILPVVPPLLVFTLLIGGEQQQRDTKYSEIPRGAIKVELPDIQQPDGETCGVAALMSILAYYGHGTEDFDVLRKDLGTNREGTNYQSIVKYAKTHGLAAEIHSDMTMDQLQRYIDQGKPVICSIQAYDDNRNHSPERKSEIYEHENVNGHYVVAMGQDEGNLFFMDPSLTGRRGYLPKGEFEKRWHDNEGTKSHPNVIHRLGLVIWKEHGESVYSHRARKID